MSQDNQQKVIRIMLVDDHAVVRAGYRFLLGSHADMQVVAEADNGEQALERYPETVPDVVVMDLTMPGMGGLVTLRRLLEKTPGARVLVFTMHENTAFAEQALQAGAAGYISKNSSPEVLISALRKVAAGGTYVDSKIAQDMVIEQTRHKGSFFAGLTAREFQILCLYAEARTLEDIALELSLSSKTIANYLSQIKDKLQVTNTAELVRLAISKGLVKV